MCSLDLRPHIHPAAISVKNFPEQFIGGAVVDDKRHFRPLIGTGTEPSIPRIKSIATLRFATAV